MDALKAREMVGSSIRHHIEEILDEVEQFAEVGHSSLEYWCPKELLQPIASHLRSKGFQVSVYPVCRHIRKPAHLEISW